MLGVVIISHGMVAQGLYETVKLFLGENIPQFGYVSLFSSDSPEAFDEKLHKAMEEVDSGEGLVVLADLYGGTPCNRTMYNMKNNIHLITGVNLPALIEVLGNRDSISSDANAWIEAGRQGIQYVNSMMEE